MITGLLFAAALTAQTLPGQKEKVMLWDSTHCEQLVDTASRERCRLKVSQGIQVLVDKSELKTPEATLKNVAADSVVAVEEKALAELTPITPADSASILFAREYQRRSKEMVKAVNNVAAAVWGLVGITVIGIVAIIVTNEDAEDNARNASTL